MAWKNKNFGKSPQDPDYLEDYDAEEDYDCWFNEQELKQNIKDEIITQNI